MFLVMFVFTFPPYGCFSLKLVAVYAKECLSASSFMAVKT